MAFLATLIGYVGTVTAIAVALLMSLSAFLAPSQPKVPLQAVKMAPESVMLKAMAISSTAKIVTPKIAPATRGTVQVPSWVSAQTVDAVPEDTIHKIRSIPEFRHDAYAHDAYAHNAYAHNVQVADAPSQDQYPHRFVLRGHAKPRGHLIGLNFAARYMGYVDNPSGDMSRLR